MASTVARACNGGTKLGAQKMGGRVPPVLPGGCATAWIAVQHVAKLILHIVPNGEI
jgi:hypothetical protein